jgi:hypothetical protein
MESYFMFTGYGKYNRRFQGPESERGRGGRRETAVSCSVLYASLQLPRLSSLSLTKAVTE